MITIKTTAGMGRGVYATRGWRAGERIESFHTIRIPASEVKAGAGSTLSTYWFEDDADGTALVVLGWLELVNHSLAPNVERTWRTTPEGEVVTLHTLRDIVVGEQILIDYRFSGGPDDPVWSREGGSPT